MRIGLWTILWLAVWAGCASGDLAAQQFARIFDQPERPWFQRQVSNAPLNSIEGEGSAENGRSADGEEGAGEEREEPLETDRDSFTPAVTTVGRGRLIYETSYSFIQNRSTANDHSFPEIITRIGVSKRLELRLGWNYEAGGGGDVSNGAPGSLPEERGSTRESQMLYGFKYSLSEQRGWIPASATIIQATTPTSGPNNFTDFDAAYVFGWKFYRDWQLTSSLRYVPTRDKGDHFNQWAPSVVMQIPVADRWAVHGEFFGIVSNGQGSNTNSQYFSPGAHYLITPNCEVGVRVGWGLTQDAANFFSNVGIGLRF